MADPRELKRIVEKKAAALTADPDRGKASGHTLVRLGEGLTCSITDGPWRLTSDQPERAGGADQGPNPGVLIRGALGSCLAMDIRTWAARLDVQIDAVTVEVTSHLDARGMLGIDDRVPAGFQRLRLRITLESSASEAELRRVVARAEAHNPRLHDLTQAVFVERELSLREPETEVA